MRWALVALFLLPAPAVAIECQQQAGNGSWGWRIVDGRKCWYEGRRVVAKERLHWINSGGGVESRHAGRQTDRAAVQAGDPDVGSTPTAPVQAGVASGPPGQSKPVPQKTADAAPEQPSRLEHSAASAPPAQILFPVVVAGNILETYPMIWPQPWLASESIMQWPRLLDIDRVPFAAWDKRIGQ